MDKIASPQDLQAEIRRLLAYSQSPKPSREKLASELRGLADRVAADEDKVEKALKGYMHHVKGTKPKFQPSKALTQYVERALAQSPEEQLKALKGILSHNDSVKEDFKLPESLIRQVKEALKS
jgi:hypothetical protein